MGWERVGMLLVTCYYVSTVKAALCVLILWEYLSFNSKEGGPRTCLQVMLTCSCRLSHLYRLPKTSLPATIASLHAIT